MDNLFKIMNFKEKVLGKLCSSRLDIFNSENEKIAYLELITERDINDSLLIEKITLWREMYKSCFLSEFIPTKERTKKWLDSTIIRNDNRLLFKIYTLDNKIVGHIGAIYRGDFIEYDYFILGCKVEIKDFALTIAREFLLWVVDIGCVEYVLGNVRYDNAHAIDFHLRTGFSIHKRIPLKKIYINQDEFKFEVDLNLVDSKFYIVEIRAFKLDLI